MLILLVNEQGGKAMTNNTIYDHLFYTECEIANGF